MGYNKEVLTCQYFVVSFFVQHFAYYKSLSAVEGRINDHDFFWARTIFGHLELAVIEWCKVFGSPKEQTHWTKAIGPCAVQQASQDFCHRLLSKTGFTQNEWKDYQTKMLILRNKFVAHLDMGGVMQGGLPHFDPALQVAYAYEEWAKAIEPALKEHDSLRYWYEKWKAEESSVVSLYNYP